MPRSVERFLLLFFFSSTVAMAVVVWRTDLQLSGLLQAPATPKVIETVASPSPSEAQALVATTVSGPSTSPEPEPSVIRVASRSGGGGGPWARLAENPEAMRLLALRQRADLDERYADLYRWLQLPPDRLAALQSLLAERQNVRRDVAAAARSQGINPRENRAEFDQMVAAAESQITEDLKALLSPDQYQKLVQYEQTGPQRALIESLNTRLSYTGTPLSPSQSAALLSILPSTSATESNAPRGGLGAFTRTATATVTAEVLAQSTSFLTADQTAALKALQDEQLAAAQLRDLLRNGGNRPPPPPID